MNVGDRARCINKNSNRFLESGVIVKIHPDSNPQLLRNLIHFKDGQEYWFADHELDTMVHFTAPEKININELKRLLDECFDVVFDCLDRHSTNYDLMRKIVSRKIDGWILTGDDS